MKQIKYTDISKKKIRKIFWIGCVLGGAMWSIFGGLDAATPSNLYHGLRDFGLVLLSGTIAFCGGLMVNAKE